MLPMFAWADGDRIRGIGNAGKLTGNREMLEVK